MKLFFLTLTAWLGSLLFTISFFALSRKPEAAIFMMIVGGLMTIAPFLGRLRITMKPKKQKEQITLPPQPSPIFLNREEVNIENHPVDPYDLTDDVKLPDASIHHVEWTIVYGNSGGKYTERTISDVSLHSEMTISAYCDLQNKRRKFILTDITELFDEDTGEVVKKDISKWVLRKIERLEKQNNSTVQG